MTAPIDHEAAPTAETDLDLDARYGRTPAFARRNRFIGIVAAVAFAVVFAAWAIWAGLLTSPASIEVRSSQQIPVSDSEIRVGFELSVPPGSAASCAVQALNDTFTVVGWRIVDIPPSESRTRSFTEPVRTTEPASSGLIYRCWLT